jgi:hypothetical protein
VLAESAGACSCLETLCESQCLLQTTFMIVLHPYRRDGMKKDMYAT